MKTGVIITIVIFALMFLFVVRALWQEWKEGRKPSPDDLLHDLSFKIRYSEINPKSELYLIRQIKELKLRKDIDKEKLSVFESRFRQRFNPQLVETDEHSPENLDDLFLPDIRN